jgi:hypothetical protein
MEFEREYEYELVEACKKFMKDFNNVSVRYVYNPFTDRKVKKGSSTYTSIYFQVKKYLEGLDDEEYHSPLKIDVFKVDVVQGRQEIARDPHLSKNVLEKDRVDNDWPKRLAKRFKAIADHKEIVINEGFNLTTWKYDSPIYSINDEDLEILKMKWIQNHPEVYSFIDTYKPEVFQMKFLVKHLVSHDYHYAQFSQWLQISADVFIRKTYESYTSSIPNERRYPVSIILFWIYQPFIFQARKFLKKHKKDLDDMIQKKPANHVKISKQQLSSIFLAFFIRSAKVEDLDKIKVNYQEYFENTMKEAIELINRENMISRPGFRQLFTEFMAARIRPYRYTNIRFGDLENFDKIVELLENPQKPINKDLELEDEPEDEETEEHPKEEQIVERQTVEGGRFIHSKCLSKQEVIDDDE